MLCLHDSIRHDDPAVQRLLDAVADAPSLTAVILAAWQVARVLTVHLVEAVLAERARRPLAWPRCPQCGVFLRRKGFATRQVMSLFGPMRWRRRVGRCPHRCETPQVAPLDEALGVQPHQRTSGERPSLGWALAVFVPCATAARLLGWDRGRTVSPQAVGGGASGWSRGDGDPPGTLARAGARRPACAGGAGGRPRRRSLGAGRRWGEGPVATDRRPAHREDTMAGNHSGCVGSPGSASHADRQGRHPAAPPSAGRSLGGVDALQPRWWLAAVRQGIRQAPQVVWLSDAPAGCGGGMRSAGRPTPWASWTFPTPRSPCGRERRPGGTAAPPRRVGGVAGPGTGCGMASRTGSWPTGSRPWRSRACLPLHGRR